MSDPRQRGPKSDGTVSKSNRGRQKIVVASLIVAGRHSTEEQDNDVRDV
jgi:hypothetical protein